MYTWGGAPGILGPGAAASVALPQDRPCPPPRCTIEFSLPYRAPFLPKLPLSLPLAHTIVGALRHPQQRHVPVVEPLLALCPARRRASPETWPNPIQASPIPPCQAFAIACSSPFTVVRSPKVEDNTLIYFLNHILNLVIYRCNIDAIWRFTCMILEIRYIL
jgi:hypothetical protein